MDIQRITQQPIHTIHLAGRGGENANATRRAGAMDDDVTNGNKRRTAYLGHDIVILGGYPIHTVRPPDFATGVYGLLGFGLRSSFVVLVAFSTSEVQVLIVPHLRLWFLLAVLVRIILFLRCRCRYLAASKPNEGGDGEPECGGPSAQRRPCRGRSHPTRRARPCTNYRYRGE